MPRDPEVVVSEFRAVTPDRWGIELKRYRLREGPSARERLPVVLCHGIVCSARFWDLMDGWSFARQLAREGYDVWVPSLRGSGLSTKPPLYVLREILQYKLPGLDRLRWGSTPRPDSFDWTFDDHVLKDLPAVIDFVKAETGSAGVVWVGHSLGAAAMYGYLERCDRGDVAAFVSVAGPIHMPSPADWWSKVAMRCRGVMRLGRALFNAQSFAGIGAITGHLPYEYLRCNRRNIETRVLRALYRNVINDAPPGLFSQMLKFAVTGSLVSVDGAFDYTAEIGRVRVPMLCIAGKADRLCVPEAVRYAYEHVGSADRSYVELSRANGFSADYGHVDTVLGKRSREEVYPIILNWLANHDRP